MKNEISIVMQLSRKDNPFTLLFSGDMEGPTAKKLATEAATKTQLKSTHYKIAHHGASALANKKEWLDAVNPDEAHVSCVYYGTFGHPRCKYLGVLLTPNLSWLPHINFLRSKAKRILGLIYRQFYQSCPPSTLLVLYKCLVRPVLEYCSILWDPSSKNTINSIESVQYLALKIVSKSWNSDYESLLSQFNLQTSIQTEESKSY